MTKYLRVTMEDGSKWDVPALTIATDKAMYYATRCPPLEFTKVYEDEVANTMADDSELIDWAANNMNWSDVEAVAVKVETMKPDYQEGWINGEKEVIEK